MLWLAVVYSDPEVHPNPLVSELGEAASAAEPAVFTEDTRGVMPPGTQVLRHIQGVQNGKCRYECYEEEICSAYSWTGSSNECTLFQAPNHLRSASANNAWHMSAANLTGIPYKADETELAMLAAAKKMAEEAKEHERRGKMSIDENLKEEIAAIKKRTSAEVRASDDAEKAKQLGMLAKFQISEMKNYVAKHRDGFQAEINRQADFYSREAAKSELRSDSSMKLLREENFKGLDKKIEDLADEMKPTVKGKVVREITRVFLRSMRKDVLLKATQFKKEMILAREKKESAEKVKVKETEKKKSEKIKLKKLEAKKDKNDLVKYAVNEQQQKKKAKAEQAAEKAAEKKNIDKKNTDGEDTKKKEGDAKAKKPTKKTDEKKTDEKKPKL